VLESLVVNLGHRPSSSSAKTFIGSHSLPLSSRLIGPSIGLSSPQGGQPRWFICSARRDLGLRTRRLCKSTWNNGDTVSYTGSGLRRVKPYVQFLVFVLRMKVQVVLRRTPLLDLYWLKDKVGGPRVQVGYNVETYLR
jgi:hypothetical protein